MFRKLVSNLPFSPALVGQLSFYIRRLKREEATRRLGLIFTVLAVALQSFAVFVPPEQAIARNGSSIIDGGIRSINDLLNVYDNPSSDVKPFMDYVGITRGELAGMNPAVQYICSSDKEWISFGRAKRYAESEEHKVPLPAGGVSLFYSVHLYRFDSVNNRVNCYDAYVGESAKIGTFSVLRKCANLQIKKKIEVPPQIESVSKTKEAKNLTEDAAADAVTASASDRLEFTLTTKNTGNIPTLAPIKDDIADVLEYATLIDAGGGILDPETKVLNWGSVQLAVNETDTRRFVVQLLDTIPTTPRAGDDPSSHDCVITNTYGNTTEVRVDCPPIKDVESAVKTIPATGPGENMAFATILLMVVVYMYTRSRQLSKEAGIIRKDYVTGAP